MTRRLQAAGLFLLVLVGFNVSAHEQRASVTRVQLNERTDSLEIMHRFSIHDVEHASRTLFDRPTDVLGSEADRERFAQYVHERFSLFDQGGHKLVLKPVGHEVDGRYLWVYAEATLPSPLTELTLSHSALHEVWPTQSNLVTIKIGDTQTSASFSRASGPATVKL